jgi:D-amino-acid oxidase
MPTYLGYLQARFEQAGGRVETATVRSLTGAARERGARAVVNCTGAGAHGLVPDPDLTAFRGQVVVAANPGITEFFIGPADAEADLVYLFPHGDTVVLGGTEVAGDWNTEPVPALAERIMRDCAAVDPRLRGAPVLDHRVGLRPFRPQIRLEMEAPHPEAPDSRNPLVVHNYGHGGAGITMSWGCAREAATLVTDALSATG